MARQCTQPKKRRDASWFKEKVLLVQAHAEGKELDEEQLTFLIDLGVVDGQVAQKITYYAAFQTDDLDTYDFDCDDISSAKVILMANLSSCDSDVLSEANNESKIVNESLTAKLERYKKRVKILEQRVNVDLSSREKFIDLQIDDMIRIKNTKFAAFETKIDTLKQTLSKHVKEKESLLTTLNGFKMKFKEIESKSIDKDIVLENKNKELKNIASQRIKPILYDGNVLSKTHDVVSVVDDEETLILAEKSRLKMVEKQNDPIMNKEKINITLINYTELNKLAEGFGKHFVPQQELSAEQKFWLQSFDKNFKEPSTSNTPVKIEVPRELPKVDSHKPKESNQPLLHSTGVIGFTGASRSKPTGNKKNNRISQSSSFNKADKIEDQSRSVKSRKNKKNSVAKTECNAYVMQSMLNANSKSVCAICNECLYDANHDKCVLDYVHDMNVLFESKLAKRKNKKQIWKPTGKVYTEIGYKWKPTGRTFTIVRNKRPLTRELICINYPLVIMKSSPIYLLSKASKTKSWLWHQCLPHLNFGSVNQLAKQGLVIAKADVGIFIRYAPAKKAYLIYNRRTRRNMETIHVDFDKLIAMASEQSSSGPALHEMTPGTLSSRLVPQPPSSTPFVSPTRDDWDTLLQPLFDEHFRPTPCVDHPVLEVVALVSAVLTGSPYSTSVHQDTPSPSTSQTSQASPSYVVTPSAEEADHDIEVSHMDNNPQFGIPIPKPCFKESSSQLLAFAAHMNMVVYQMDVKTAFLNGILREEVYAPKAWYDLLSSFLLSQKFFKGTVDPTLFIKR
nr:hypothetical protein [Tanacetum cinerariifolium]